MVLVFLAEGFEEIEALATVDILRRAELDVATVGVTGRVVRGAHGIPVVADWEPDAVSFADMQAVVLPGGMPGTRNLEASATVQAALDAAVEGGRLIGAICAAPTILGHRGLLKGRRATCFPGCEKELIGAVVTGAPAERDGLIVTGKSAGCAVPFALKLVAALCSPEKAAKLEASLQCR